jgi:hypothetical protein
MKHVHHIDGNLSNNDPANIRLIGAEENVSALGRDAELIRAAKKIVEFEGLLKRWLVCFDGIADPRLCTETRQALESIK